MPEGLTKRIRRLPNKEAAAAQVGKIGETLAQIAAKRAELAALVHEKEREIQTLAEEVAQMAELVEEYANTYWKELAGGYDSFKLGGGLVRDRKLNDLLIVADEDKAVASLRAQQCADCVQVQETVKLAALKTRLRDRPLLLQQLQGVQEEKCRRAFVIVFGTSQKKHPFVRRAKGAHKWEISTGHGN